MRTLTPARASDCDDGAVLVMVALMMTMLLGVGALVIDLGALYVEKRELQNGADAAALAIAQGCAGGNCGAPNAIAKQYVDLNARDGASGVAEVCGSPAPLAACSSAAPAGAAGATGWVKVSDVTESSGGGNQVQFVLAPIMNSLTGATMRSSAVAAWGPLGRRATLPFTMSICEYNQMGGNLSTGALPTGVSYIFSKRNNANTYDPSCPQSSGGGTVPGNFGWLETSGGCLVNITAGGTVRGDTGNDPNPIRQECGVETVQNQVVVLPVFSSVVEQGNNATYTIAGFVGYRITGYQLSGASWPSGFSCPPPLGSTATGGNLRCFRGEFTPTVTGGEFGGGANFGVSVVKMVG